MAWDVYLDEIRASFYFSKISRGGGGGGGGGVGSNSGTHYLSVFRPDLLQLLSASEGKVELSNVIL